MEITELLQNKAGMEGGEYPKEVLSLPVSRYQFIFRAEEDIRLPAYAGSAWRGVFGHGLKRSLCVTKRKDCPGCLLWRNCVYAYLFETPPPQGSAKLRRYPAAPHPFVLEPDEGARVISVGEHLQLGCVLIGRANTQLPYIVQAFRLAGQKGVGQGNGRFSVEKVYQERQLGSTDWEVILDRGEELLRSLTIEPPHIPPLPESVVIRFRTPLRVQRDGSLIGPEDFAFHDLFRTLLRRLSLLSYFHTNDPWELDFKGLNQASRVVPIRKKRLRWGKWIRYSSRQQTEIQMDGVQGEVVLDGALFESFWPFLWLGQWTHAGKGAVMGLGRYTLEDIASLPNSG